MSSMMSGRHAHRACGESVVSQGISRFPLFHTFAGPRLNSSLIRSLYQIKLILEVEQSQFATLFSPLVVFSPPSVTDWQNIATKQSWCDTVTVQRARSTTSAFWPGNLPVLRNATSKETGWQYKKDFSYDILVLVLWLDLPWISTSLQFQITRKIPKLNSGIRKHLLCHYVFCPRPTPTARMLSMYQCAAYGSKLQKKNHSVANLYMTWAFWMVNYQQSGGKKSRRICNVSEKEIMENYQHIHSTVQQKPTELP